MRLWVISFLPVRAYAAAHRSIQQGTADAVVTDVYRGDPVSKEGFCEWGGGSLQNCLACCVFEKTVSKFWILASQFWFLAKNPGGWQGMWRVWD